MVAILTPAERERFKECRRAWDFEAPGRRNLEPMVSVDPPDVDRWIRDALAVYYFPGMWDWTRAVVIPLVTQALDKAVARDRARLSPDLPPGFEGRADAAGRLLRAYLDWAPTVERLAPVLVEVPYAADLLDPVRSDTALFTSSGQHISYRGRLDLLGVDEHDAYWIVRHRVVKNWTPLDSLIRDEEAVAACWAWSQYYIGMEIAGTIHNEMRLPTRGRAEGTGTPSGTGATGREWEPATERGGVAQHEASGGGRSVPQHRRLYAQASEPVDPEPVVHDVGPWFRRTSIRRSRAEVQLAGRQVASEARELFNPEVAVYPSPSEAACRRCAFAAPCLALFQGRVGEAEGIVGSCYRLRPDDEVTEGRLGEVTWSTGRGAAPPRFFRGETAH
jgi:hypothetical protein